MQEATNGQSITTQDAAETPVTPDTDVNAQDAAGGNKVGVVRFLYVIQHQA
jgi:hypothetical protein